MGYRVVEWQTGLESWRICIVLEVFKVFSPWSHLFIYQGCEGCWRPSLFSLEFCLYLEQMSPSFSFSLSVVLEKYVSSSFISPKFHFSVPLIFLRLCSTCKYIWLSIHYPMTITTWATDIRCSVYQ